MEGGDTVLTESLLGLYGTATYLEGVECLSLAGIETLGVITITLNEHALYKRGVVWPKWRLQNLFDMQKTRPPKHPSEQRQKIMHTRAIFDAKQLLYS